MNYFEYDSSVFEQAYTNYEKAEMALSGLADTLQNDVDTLVATGWNTEAGKAFKDSYTNEWKPILENYLSLLGYLKKCVEYAKSKEGYNNLVDEAETLKF